MIKKLIFAVLLGSFATGAHAAAPENCADLTTPPTEKLTLEAAVELGLCRNFTTKIAYENVRSAKFQKYQNYAGYLPSVNANASANWRDDSGYFDISGKPTSAAGLSASWLLFDFGRRESDLGAAISAWNAAGFDYDQSIQSFVFDLISAYYGALMAQADEKTNTDMLKVAEQSYQTAVKKFNAGAVPKADRLKAETQLAQRRVDLQQSAGNTKIAMAKLLNLMSFDSDNELALDDEFTPPELEQRDINELMKTARDLRPDLQSIRESADAADYRLYSSYLKNLPSLTANAGADYDLNNETKSSSVSLRISMPLFAGFANLNAARAARAASDAAQYRAQNKELAVEREVWDAFQNYNTATSVLKSTHTLLESAKESERVVSGMYGVGRATMLDWLVAQSELATAQRQAIYARYDLLIKKYALALAIGELGK